MPEVDWTPYAPGIKLYNPEDWAWMDKEGTTGIRPEGAMYVTFPIHLKRIYGTVQYTLPKRTWKDKIRDRIVSLAWGVINRYEGE